MDKRIWSSVLLLGFATFSVKVLTQNPGHPWLSSICCILLGFLMFFFLIHNFLNFEKLCGCPTCKRSMAKEIDQTDG